MPTWKADAIADLLLGEIAAGVFRPEQVLPTEHELMERFDASRGSVREALKQLEVHGLVEARRKRGTVVVDPRSSTSAVVLRALVRESEKKGDPKLRGDVLEIRTALLTLACTLARKRATPMDHMTLKGALSLLAQATPKHRPAALLSFWSAVNSIARNDALVLLTHWYRVAMRDIPIPSEVDLRAFERVVAWIIEPPSRSRSGEEGFSQILALVEATATRRDSSRPPPKKKK